MILGPTAKRIVNRARHIAGALFLWLSSVKLTMVLLSFVGAAVACGILLGISNGREWAQWYVYRREWFLALLVALSATALRRIGSAASKRPALPCKIAVTRSYS